MKTIYACTYVRKTAIEDSFEEGLVGHEALILDEGRNITAPTLEELIKKVGEAYYIDIEEIFLPSTRDDTAPGRNAFAVYLMETNDGYKPDDDQLEQWKAGKLKLFYCDYEFTVEKRVVSRVSRDEFKATGIKWDSE